MSPQARTRTLIAGNPIHKMENRRFFNQVPSVVKMPALENTTNTTGKNKMSETLDFEPMIAHRKKQANRKTLRMRRRLVGQSIDTAIRKLNDASEA